jgi:hypothetical protein
MPTLPANARACAMPWRPSSVAINHALLVASTRSTTTIDPCQSPVKGEPTRLGSMDGSSACNDEDDRGTWKAGKMWNSRPSGRIKAERTTARASRCSMLMPAGTPRPPHRTHGDLPWILNRRLVSFNFFFFWVLGQMPPSYLKERPFQQFTTPLQAGHQPP